MKAIQIITHFFHIMQLAHSINNAQEHYIEDENKKHSHNMKEPLAEEMEITIKSLSKELNEARKVLRQKKQDLDTRFSISKNDEIISKREYNKFLDKMSGIEKQSYNSNLIFNSTKLNTDFDESEKKKSSNPKGKLIALKQLLVIVNKINKTYDPIRI